MSYTLEDLVDIFVETCSEVEEVMGMEMEIYETPHEFVCMALFVVGIKNKRIVRTSVGTGIDEDKYLVVDWDKHGEVIEMFKERMKITKEDEEVGYFSVTY